MAEMERITVSVPDAAKMIGVGKTYMYRLINEKRVVAVRLGCRTLVKVDSLRALADSLPALEGSQPGA